MKKAQIKKMEIESEKTISEAKKLEAEAKKAEAEALKIEAEAESIKLKNIKDEISVRETATIYTPVAIDTKQIEVSLETLKKSGKYLKVKPYKNINDIFND